MLSLPGRPVLTCEGFTRREWLRVGGLSTFGLSLDQLLQQRRARGGETAEEWPASFGRAKACIVLFLFGAPAHQDTWDLKPDAPLEIRGEFQSIPTNVQGVRVCEHMPLLAQRMDQLTQIRSVTHPDNTHTVALHYMLTGVRHRRFKSNPQNAGDDFPCYGSVVNYLNHRPRDSRGSSGRLTTAEPLPPSISLNAPANQVSANNHIFPGFFAGFLGHSHDPLFVSQHPNAARFDPFPTLGPASRLLDRQRLLSSLGTQRRAVENSPQVATLGSDYERAFSLLTSPGARRAFQMTEESPALRERYGDSPFGQACLLARRLVEAGTTLVTVNWERDDAYWDTHKNNFRDLKNSLLPNFDRGFSALLDDLRERGLLDETLVVCLGEFGRSPQINRDAGREHWAACNTVVLAGAGLPGGLVHGASDRTAASPLRDPVYPEDLSATLYHLLGIDAHRMLRDLDGREIALSSGQLISSLL